MKKQIIVMGVSGSGKTAVGTELAQRLHCEFYDADHFHPAVNIEKMSQGIALTDDDRIPWLQSIADFLKQQIQAHRSSVLACSALKKSYRDILRIDASVLFVFLKGDLEVIMPRMLARTDHYMPTSLLESQLRTLEEPVNAIEVNINASLDEIVAAILSKPEISEA